MAHDLTPGELALRARLAAHHSWANTADRTARTDPGRRAFDERFLEQVDPAITDPEARRLAAQSLKKAHFARLAFLSVTSRRASRTTRQAAQPDAA